MNAYNWIGEVKRTKEIVAKNGKSFYTFTVYNKETGFVNCVCFHGRGSAVREGDEIELTNYFIQNRSYTGNDGIKKYNQSVVVNQFEIYQQTNGNNIGVPNNTGNYSMPNTVTQQQESINWDDGISPPPVVNPHVEATDQGVPTFEEFKKQYEGMASDESIIQMWEWKKMKGVK